MKRNALNRIKWRIESGYWKADKNDIEAFNSLVDLVNIKNNASIEKNKTAYSIYASCFLFRLNGFGLTFLNELSQKEFHKSLDRPIDLIINEITSELNFMAQLKFFRDLKIELLYPDCRNPMEKEDELSKIKSLLKDPNKFDQFFGNTWSYNEVESNIRNNFLSFLDVCNK
ncbi:hypothetical protein ACPX19_01400 [Winogradskyella sp. HB-48]|uniref:hypothetical protein n=1 Tax=Winogradskyella sp. HB-48 TaxID=3416808 RepID=UPI003CED3C34